MPPYRIVHIDVGKRICFPHDNSLNFPLLNKGSDGRQEETILLGVAKAAPGPEEDVAGF